MSTSWQWSARQLENIDSWNAASLIDLHFALFKEFANVNLVKRRLRRFPGLVFQNADEQNQHTQFISKEIDVSGFQRICKFLEIEFDDKADRGEAASKIMEKVATQATCKVGELNLIELRSTHSETSNISKQIEILEQVTQLDEERMQLKRETLDKSKQLREMQKRKLDLEKENPSENAEMIDKLADDIKEASLELETLQCEIDSLVSKKNFLNAKIKILTNRSPSRENASMYNGSDRAKMDVLSQIPQSELSNSTYEKAGSFIDTQRNQEMISLQNTVANMLARQTLGSKLPDFDGSSTLEWRHFVNQFHLTSRECQYTQEENVYRLNKSLKGAARQKVELLLMSVTNPTKILTVLENIYGNSDHVALEIIAKAYAAPYAEDLDKYQDFNCVVQNIHAAMDFTDKRMIDVQKLFSILLGKLPENDLKEWASYLKNMNVRATQAEFSMFAEWTQQSADTAQDLSFFKKLKQINEPKKNLSKPPPTIKSQCTVCGDEKHPLDKCRLFKQFDVKKRWDVAEKAKACYCCLRFHMGKCSSRKVCGSDGCQRFHHTLLHKNNQQAPQHKETTNVITGSTVESSKCSLLKMVPVRVYGFKGFRDIIAFLDEGSTTTMLDMQVAKDVGIPGKVSPFCFNWTGGIFRYEAEAELASICLTGQKSGEQFILDDVQVIPKLNLPYQNINYKELVAKFPYVMESKFEGFENCQPMLLIGQRHAQLITTRAVIDPDENGPMLSKTKLGWAMHGPINLNTTNINSFTCCQVDDELHQMVKQQFSLENFGVSLSKTDKTKSMEDQRAIKLAENSIKKVSGRFQLNLPWRKDDVQLPEIKQMAMQRLKCLERKLQKNKAQAVAYQSEIDKLIDKGYARKVVDVTLLSSNKIWFLPHFAVFNPSKPAKVRIVFDAAAKSNGTSLNENLLTGPDWLTSIVGVLMRFRRHSIAFAGDIKEMFNRVLIADEDTSAQCFLWRNINTNTPPTIYQMKAMLFGINSSPFMAQFVKNHNAQSFNETNPAATEAVIRNHYVDDYLDSKESVAEAVNIILAVIDIHKRAGFEIRNFISNNCDVLKQLPPSVRSDSMMTLVGDKTLQGQKILGILWDATEDIFTYSTKQMRQIDEQLMNNTALPTKRKILSAVNSIYDPIGLVTPFTIKGRILMRDVWESGICWDDVIKGDLIQKWQSWLDDLQNINLIKIKRCYSKHSGNATRIELHVFNDASSKAYSSAAYLRVCFQADDKEKFDVALIASKARVSPLKYVTIPKLETLAAVLGCRLAETIQQELEFRIDKRYFWTDSKTVISWINTERPLQAFVATRVGEICEKTEKSEWHWISSTTNIADVITRDRSSMQATFEHWIQGPNFLKTANESWVPDNSKITIQNDIVMTLQSRQIYQNCFHKLTKFSSFYKILRITAWARRFIQNTSSKCHLDRIDANEKITNGYLLPDEIDWARKMWCKAVQQECYPNDYAYIKSGKQSQQGRLSKYSLILDEDGILRISGRIERAKHISVQARNPIVLDGKHAFTKLLLYELHKRANHTGLQVVVHMFKQKYWMPKMTHTIKSTIKECLWCRKNRSKNPIQPKMGILPKERFLAYEKPFSATGIDYFGPFYTRDGRGSSGRYTKTFRTRYGVIFTCLTTRAVHVEIAHSLSTDSCIMAIRRMMARRGNIKTIWSDNGTNFRGASRELLEAIAEIDEKQIMSSIAPEGAEWKFIPANTPNFGGCWERLVGCFKRSIEAVLSVDRNPTDEVMQTIFCEAEHLVNSRPYILESDDPEDDIGLCPNDILIQQSGAVCAPGIFSKYDANHKKLWRISQLLIDNFWSRFLKEYIPTLLHRSKWQKDVENVKEGEVVLLRENNTPRGDWPVGLVTKVYPGEDNIVRVVDVRTSKNEYKRPVNRLYKMESQCSSEEYRADERNQH